MSADAERGPVAVDGAELFLGRAIARALLARGVAVRAVTLDDASAIPEGAERALAPLGDAEAVRKALDGARAVVAARKLLEEGRGEKGPGEKGPGEGGPGEKGPGEGLTFERVHAERTRHLAAGAESAGAERFLYIGIAGAEKLPKGRLKAAETVAEARVASAKVPALTLAPSLVVGPGDGHVSRMARKANAIPPVLVFVGQGWARSAPMTLSDFGECAAETLLAEEFETGKLTVGGPELMTAMDIQDRLLRHFGRRKLKVHVPESVARLGAAVVERLSRRPPVTRARLAWLLDDLIPDRVTSTALLGHRPRRFETAFPREVDAPALPDASSARG